jgi:hypothetical protein
MNLGSRPEAGVHRSKSHAIEHPLSDFVKMIPALVPVAGIGVWSVILLSVEYQDLRFDLQRQKK